MENAKLDETCHVMELLGPRKILTEDDVGYKLSIKTN